MEKKLIIFDCYGTLLTSPKSNPHSKFLENIGVDVKAFKRKIMTEQSIDWHSLVSNSMTDANYKEHFDTLSLELQLELRTIVPYLSDIATRLDKLRESYKVVILSNLSEEYAAPIEKYLANHVDHCFYSFEIGKAKPNLEAFEHVLEWYSNNYGEIHPMEVILVDDNSQNVNRVKFLGVQGFLVNNAHLESPFSIKSFFQWLDEH